MSKIQSQECKYKIVHNIGFKKIYTKKYLLVMYRYLILTENRFLTKIKDKKQKTVELNLIDLFVKIFGNNVEMTKSFTSSTYRY